MHDRRSLRPVYLQADSYDYSIYGRVVDPNSGVLNNLRVGNTFALTGPAAWCLVDGRTN